MRVLDQFRTLEVLCAATKQWGMAINWYGNVEPEQEFEELQKAAPYLKIDEHAQSMIEGRAYLLFDTEEEMEKHFWMTVGDDGPTALNDYNGPMRVYAITCDPTGQLLNENT